MRSRASLSLAVLGAGAVLGGLVWLLPRGSPSAPPAPAAGEVAAVADRQAEPSGAAPARGAEAEPARVEVPAAGEPRPAAAVRGGAVEQQELPEARTWLVRVRAGGELVPCAELVVRRAQAAEVLQADGSGRIVAALAAADRVQLRLPGAGGAELPARVEPEAAGGAAIVVDLRAVILVAPPGGGTASVEWLLVPTGSRVDPSSGRLFTELGGWPCGADRIVFPVPGTAEEVDPAQRERARFVVRDGSERPGTIEVPWPCWASDGVQRVLPWAADTASLRVLLTGTGATDGDVALQVTLKDAGAPRSSRPLAVELARIGGVAEFRDLEPRAVTLFVSGERVALRSLDLWLVPGPNEIEVPLELSPEPLAFEVRVSARGGELDEALHVAALPEHPGAPFADVALQVTRGADGAQRGRAQLTLAPGDWRLRVYSAASGVTYLKDHRVRAQDGFVELVLEAPARRIPIHLAEDAPTSGLDFWLDASGEGLRLTSSGARPGGALAEVPESATAVAWVLVGLDGPVAFGGLGDLRAIAGEDGGYLLLPSPGPSSAAPHIVRLASIQRGGREGTIGGRRTDALGYLGLEGAPDEGIQVQVDGSDCAVLARAAQPWGTTLWIAD